MEENMNGDKADNRVWRNCGPSASVAGACLHGQRRAIRQLTACQGVALRGEIEEAFALADLLSSLQAAIVSHRAAIRHLSGGGLTASQGAGRFGKYLNRE